MEGNNFMGWIKRHPFLTFMLGWIIFIMLLLSMCDGDAEKSGTQKSLHVGDEGVLYVEGSKTVSVGRTEEALKELTKALVANDKIGFMDVFLDGNAFMVDSGTSVLIIDNTITTRKIRILEGDFVGESGWVPYEWVRSS